MGLGISEILKSTLELLNGVIDLKYYNRLMEYVDEMKDLEDQYDDERRKPDDQQDDTFIDYLRGRHQNAMSAYSRQLQVIKSVEVQK